MLIPISLAAFASTFIGGLLALRFRDRLHLILGFSAGTVVAVAFFEIIPEAMELAMGQYDTSLIAAIMGMSFLAYLLLDRIFSSSIHKDSRRGILGAGSLSLHSILDGVAIGLAFQASQSVGLVVATAVLVHDFSDGINTVNLILKNGGAVRNALKWVVADALAPILGVASTLLFSLQPASIGLLLAVFAGTFTYIGASDLIPESHHMHPKKLTTIMTALGMAVIYIVIKIVE